MLCSNAYQQPQGSNFTLEALTSHLSQSSMGTLAADAMVRRVYHCLCSIDSGLAAAAGSGKSGCSGACGVGREQMVIFLADTLRGTSEERAPLVMAMSQNGTEPSATVSCEQVAEVSVEKTINAAQRVLVNVTHM